MEEKLWTPGFRATFVALWLGSLLTPFFMSGMVSVLPAMAREWNGTAVEISVALLNYSLAQAIFNILGGRFGDIWGRRRVLLIGVSVFTLASILMGMAGSMLNIICLRFIQGLGGAMISSCSTAIAMSLAPRAYRGRVMGLLSTAVYLGLTLGPLVAGALATWLNWRWLFYGVALPGSLVIAIILLEVKQEWREAKGEPMDWVGGGMLSLGLASLALGVISLSRVWWGLIPAGIGVLLLTVFWRFEGRVSFPIFNPHIFKESKGLSTGLLAMFLNFGVTAGLLTYFILYLQQVRMLTPFEASLFMVLQSVAQLLAAPLGGRLADRFGAERIANYGVAMCCAGTLGVAFLSPDSSWMFILMLQCGVGAGIGIFAPPNMVATLSGVESRSLAVASGMTGSMRTMGVLFSQVQVAAVLAHFMGNSPVTLETVPAFMNAMRTSLVIFVGLMLLGLVVGLRRAGRSKKK